MGLVFPQSENARLALCEHPQWTPVVVMLGLLQCSVPPVLKAEVLLCLAAFGKSPEVAASLWQSLEYTQVRPRGVVGSGPGGWWGQAPGGQPILLFSPLRSSRPSGLQARGRWLALR